jgi:hypothetical protein
MTRQDPVAVDQSFDTARLVDDGGVSPVPLREAAVGLARDVLDDQIQVLIESLSTSGWDPALRLQDGVGTRPEDGDTTTGEVGSPPIRAGQMGPVPGTYVPLVGNGNWPGRSPPTG